LTKITLIRVRAGKGCIISLMPNKNEEEVVRRAALFTALDDASAATLRESMSAVKVAK